MNAAHRQITPASWVDVGDEEPSLQFVFESIMRLEVASDVTNAPHARGIHTSTERSPHGEATELEGLPRSHEYLLAAQDDSEQTTNILAPRLEVTVRSATGPSKNVGLRNVPSTVRLPRRIAQPVDWRAPFATFVMTLSIGLVALGVVLLLLPRARWALPHAVAQAPAPSVTLPRAPSPTLPSRASVASAAVANVATQPPLAAGAEPTPPTRTTHDSTAPTLAKRSVATTSAVTTTAGTASAVASGAIARSGLVFLTTPGGGEVFDKGRWLGRAPGSFELSPGWHTLVIKAGDQDRIATLRVRANDSIMVSVPAKP